LVFRSIGLDGQTLPFALLGRRKIVGTIYDDVMMFYAEISARTTGERRLPATDAKKPD
jgi:hypothetical protein